jgi:hypothetical protein
VGKWLIQQIFGGTDLQSVGEIFAPPGKAVLPGKKLRGKDKKRGERE